jgi:hypothetical protein
VPPPIATPKHSSELPSDYEPNDYDVVCGRGKGSYNRPGNKPFPAGTMRVSCGVVSLFHCIIIAAAGIWLSPSVQAVDVCVIESGPSGIQAAYWAEEKGYTVATFEKNNHIGGKTKAITRDGRRYRMGAQLHSRKKFSSIGYLLDRFRIQPAPVPEFLVFQADRSTKSLLGTLLGSVLSGHILQSLLELTKFFYIRGILGEKLDTADSFLADYPPELNALSMNEWLDTKLWGGATIMNTLVWFFGTVFGYGLGQNIAAIHYLKYIDKVSVLDVLVYLLPRPFADFTTVEAWYFQDLLEAMTGTLNGDIYLDSTITDVAYGEDSNVITFQPNNGPSVQQVTCNSMIIAFPPTAKAIATFLPPGETGATLMSLTSQVKVMNYFSLLLRDKNDDVKVGSYFEAEQEDLADNPAENLLYIKPYNEPNSSLMAYYFSPSAKTDEQATTECLASFSNFI